MTTRRPRIAVAVLGAAGFVGRALVSHLDRGHFDVFAFGRRDYDLRDADAVKALVSALPRAARVVICATVNKNVDNTFAAFQQNTRMAENLSAALESSHVAGTVFLGTVDVYGRSPACPVHEGTPVAPADCYAVAKLASEHLLMTRSGPPLTVLRLPGVYGPGDGGGSVIGRFVRQIDAGKTVFVRGGGVALRDYVEVSDVCRTIEHFVENPAAGIFNLVKGHSRSIAETVAVVGELLGQEPAIVHQDADPAAATDLVFDAARLRRAGVAVERFRDLDWGVRRYVEALEGGRKFRVFGGLNGPLTMAGR